MERKMTPRQILFADKYIELGSAEKAALEAGYSVSYAKKRSHELLGNVGIKQYIENRMAEITNPTIASAEEVLEYLTRVMRGEEKDQFGLDTSIADRTNAADKLGKRYSLFNEKLDVRHSGSIGVQIIDDVHGDTNGTSST